ncbi:MAG: IclR family transcriptional regulator [Betaproteobacteria bacterium]|nr:IclR family transcriptional regulator [Betaproteobacteria bacterium]HMV19769.1 IclR family transcriptional regulator [Rhodocyclaceae bacterium]HMW78524.1 IclR family transcriptional regulator [Rhodocyclaceae bacterium]HNL21843.1 IclR family transcriptional regulator [Rhodocyclaceae bacterium]HNM22386.1 IclR family transcriptional regulator [Rhodocyclaceae bacterium]
MATKGPRQRQGIQSIELGFDLLRTLSAAGRPMMLRDLAAGAGMPPAKAHRYLVSLLRVGIVSQDPSSGRYDLGPAALELGLAGLGRLDPVRLAGPVLEALCESLNETVALAVWGNRGATIVRIVDAGGPITVTLRAGTVLPLHNSATGRAFAAFHRSPFVRRILDEELQQAAARAKVAITTLRRQLERNLTEIRTRGLSRATGSLTPGINGFSAPVYDHTASMVAAITSLGPVGEFNVEWDSPAALAMLDSAASLSSSLGYGSIDGTSPGAPARNRTRA